jgi:protein tyrosine phosphatase (PTP) superfamily phosphohydrolase (DUF442 family)
VFAGTVSGCSSADETPARGAALQVQQKAKAGVAERIEVKSLPNLHRIHDKVLFGGEPDGDEGFRALKELGVKTIISVDGKKPDVEAAKRFGLRYVHLPHGYDGIPEEREKELPKAVRDLEGPIYFHCHHGKHRSPAAAVVACVGAGMIDPSQGVAIFKAAGTSPNYRGLYESAEKARPLDKSALDAVEAEFSATAKIPPLAELMVDMEHTHDRLKAIAGADWKTPPDQPDLEPAHEALQLREHFAELLRADAVKDMPQEFRELLTKGLHDAQSLENELRKWTDEGAKDPPPKPIAESFSRITADCASCHKQFRDTRPG